MLMTDQTTRADRIIENHIHVWSLSSSFVPLAEILRKDKNTLTARLLSMTAHDSADNDEVRLFLLRHAMERISDGIRPDHFTLFREAETVQVILEDSYGVQPGIERDEIPIPHQNQAMKIIVRCLIRNGSKVTADKDVLCFLHLFSGLKVQIGQEQDRTMRFRSMVWLVFLAIEIIALDRSVCLRGLEYFRNRFRELLDRALEGTIIDEDSRLPGFEGGKWETSLYGWLQGEDRKQFVLKLKRQFNLQNRVDHANRFLLAEHRRCVFEQVMALFC